MTLGLCFCNLFAQKRQIITDEKQNEDKAVIEAVKEYDEALANGDMEAISSFLDSHFRLFENNDTVNKEGFIKRIKNGTTENKKTRQLGEAIVTFWGGKKGGYWHDHFVERTLQVTKMGQEQEEYHKITSKQHWIFDGSWKLVEDRRLYLVE